MSLSPLASRQVVPAHADDAFTNNEGPFEKVNDEKKEDCSLRENWASLLDHAVALYGTMTTMSESSTSSHSRLSARPPSASYDEDIADMRREEITRLIEDVVKSSQSSWPSSLMADSSSIPVGEQEQVPVSEMLAEVKRALDKAVLAYDGTRIKGGDGERLRVTEKLKRLASDFHLLSSLSSSSSAETDGAAVALMAAAAIDVKGAKEDGRAWKKREGREAVRSKQLELLERLERLETLLLPTSFMSVQQTLPAILVAEQDIDAVDPVMTLTSTKEAHSSTKSPLMVESTDASELYIAGVDHTELTIPTTTMTSDLQPKKHDFGEYDDIAATTGASEVTTSPRIETTIFETIGNHDKDENTQLAVVNKTLPHVAISTEVVKKPEEKVALTVLHEKRSVLREENNEKIITYPGSAGNADALGAVVTVGAVAAALLTKVPVVAAGAAFAPLVTSTFSALKGNFHGGEWTKWQLGKLPSGKGGGSSDVLFNNNVNEK